MADIMAPGSPLWWLRKLGKQLDDRKKELQRYDDYYEGKHPLAFATIKFETAFGDLFKGFSDNWCELVVDAVAERLKVEGFRTNDKAGNRKAWGYWQANNLDSDSLLAFNTALVQSEAYTLIWADPDTEAPVITVESPTQVAVAMEAGSRRKRTAAVKRWVDDDGYQLATVYLPDEVYKYRSRRPVTGFGGQYYAGEPQLWVDRPARGSEPWPLPNPLGLVPVVPLVNRPRLLKCGVSEIKRVMPLQDAVNKMVEDMLVASEFGAAPQRWATGLEVPVDPITKKPLDVFEHMINRLWTNKKAEGKFGQFDQTDLTIFVKAIEMLVQHIASQTRTPPHYFALSGQFPSGESIKSAETGLVAKVGQKMVHFGESLEETIRISFLVDGDTKRASFSGMETIWGDPESRSEAEHVDAVLKKKALGVPDEQLWEDVGYSPQQIEAFKQMRADAPRPVLPMPVSVIDPATGQPVQPGDTPPVP